MTSTGCCSLTPPGAGTEPFGDANLTGGGVVDDAELRAALGDHAEEGNKSFIKRLLCRGFTGVGLCGMGFLGSVFLFDMAFPLSVF